MDFLRIFWSWIRLDKKWHNDVSLINKTVVITGGNAGIGKETTRGLATKGAKVIIGCRNTAKADETAIEIGTEIEKEHGFKPSIIVKHLNLASLASVRKFAAEVLEEEEDIHILINNAGIMACPFGKTEDGFETQFGVNHLGHFLLTLLLLDRLKASAPARIVTVASIHHHFGAIYFDDINLEKDYTPLKAYGQSKLANVLFTKELAKRLEGSGVTTYSLHPGVVYSGILENYLETNTKRSMKRFFDFGRRMFFKSVKQGARTTLYCATEESLSTESGLYYSGSRTALPSRAARDPETAKRLWDLSEKLTEIHGCRENLPSQATRNPEATKGLWDLSEKLTEVQ